MTSGANFSTKEYKANSFCKPFSSDNSFTNFLNTTARGSEIE